VCYLKESEFVNHPLISKLLALGLDADDYAIYGSALLLVHGIRAINDLDVVARGRAWAEARELGISSIAPLNGAPVARLYDGMIEVTNGWITNEASVDSLIDEAEVIYGVRFVGWKYVLSYKKKLRRPKDIADIGAIERHLSSGCCSADEKRWVADSIRDPTKPSSLFDN
jgi:hypothetical protein